jgi:hypothetical protein
MENITLEQEASYAQRVIRLAKHVTSLQDINWNSKSQKPRGRPKS